MRIKTRAALAAAALAIAGLTGVATLTATTSAVADTGWGRPPADPTPSESTPSSTPVTSNDTGWG
ncbi:hypothetical protein ACFXGT_08360 [Streptomyces sp. NPDC059352]|uniref:hypothetical protein n=1 Tax=Streptomyces sp. NPDC059352 TaxID=3346810 RepID=UPI0036B7ED5C